MEVLPNGNIVPTTNISDKTPIEIVVRKESQSTLAACGVRNIPTQYFIELNGRNLANFYKNGPCAQRVETHYKTYPVGDRRLPDLEGIEAAEVYETVRSLIVHRDDADWRFILSSTSLITARDSRQLRATVPMQNYTVPPPAAATWLLTGECIMTTER
jgi:hypothetical protein